MKKEPDRRKPGRGLGGADRNARSGVATTLLYGVCHYPYRQLRHVWRRSPRRSKLRSWTWAFEARGKHDELLREFSAGQSLRFDILMDIGGFRDMHRHRKCTQILQPFTCAHGFEVPDSLTEAGLRRPYEAAMTDAHAAFSKIAHSDAPEAEQSAQYVLPLGTRNRSLFKMDFAEALYISELRSTPQGHFSYRRVAWEMYQAVALQHPTLAKYFRIEDVHAPVDLLKR